jgi:hypothetical protein
MDALNAIASRLIQRKPTFDESIAIQYVLDAAMEYTEGRLPWYEAAKIGAVSRNVDGQEVESTAYARFLAVMLTESSDPRRRAVLKLCGELVEQSGAVLTTHGFFDRGELHEINVTVRTA